MDSKRLLRLSGVAFVALVLIAVVALGGSTPGEDASAAKIAAFYDGHHGREVAAAFLLAASAPFLVAFAAALATAAWPIDPRRRPIGEIVLIAGAAVTAAAVLLAALVHFVLAAGPGNGVAGDGLKVLNLLDADAWVAFNSALGVMMLGAAGALLGRAGGYRRLGQVALVLGLALFVPFADFFALLAALVWIVVASVLLYRGEREPRRAVAPQTA